jgi:hypothetical protein
MPELNEISDTEYLRNLSDRLMGVPACYGTDQYDCDRLRGIAEWVCRIEDAYKRGLIVTDAYLDLIMRHE